jgi:two-component system, LytTR family, response regulator
MKHCIIIDDKQEAIDVIVTHLQSKPKLHLLQTFLNPVEGMDFIYNNKVDLVFLDIDMPKLTGIELIDSLRLKNGFLLPDFILITGHEEYALKGYEYGVIDYIMKPVSFKRFNQAVDRYLESKETILQKKLNDISFFFGEAEGKKIRIDIEDIIYIESESNYINIFKKDRRIVLLRSLNEMEELLGQQNFIRTHKSFIVALKQIESVTNNEAFIKYKGESIAIPIGRTFKAEFKKRLKLN